MDGLLALVISLYILWQIRQIVLLVFAAAVLSTILNRVETLQRYRIKRSIAIAITVVVLLAHHWLLCGDCATHCRVATIVQYLAASLSTTACLVRLATICDSRANVRTVPSGESPSTTSNLGSSAAEQLLSYSITRLPLSLACCCSWFWPSCSWRIPPNTDESLYWHFLSSASWGDSFGVWKLFGWLDQRYSLSDDRHRCSVLYGSVDFRVPLPVVNAALAAY